MVPLGLHIDVELQMRAKWVTCRIKVCDIVTKVPKVEKGEGNFSPREGECPLLPTLSKQSSISNALCARNTNTKL